MLASTAVTAGPVVTSAGGSKYKANTTVTSSATCPGGTFMLGGGGQVTTTDTTPGKVQLLASYPSSAATWTAIGVINSDLSNNNHTISVQAFVVCSV